MDDSKETLRERALEMLDEARRSYGEGNWSGLGELDLMIELQLLEEMETHGR